MGEIAEMMLEGRMCQGCGELLSDDAPGHPRTCAACSAEQLEDVPPHGVVDLFEAVKAALSTKPKRRRKRGRRG
jgi:hypothetical protein